MHGIVVGIFGKPDELVVRVSLSVDHTLPCGKGLLGVVHVQNRIQVMACIDEWDIDLSDEDMA